MKHTKIKFVMGRGISYNLDTVRREVKTKFNLPSLGAADEYIASCISKLLKGNV